MAIPKLVMSSQEKLKTSQDKIKNMKNPFPIKKSRGQDKKDLVKRRVAKSQK